MKNNMLNEEQKKRYLAHPANCPFCQSPDIEGETPDYDWQMVTVVVKCDTCGKNYKEIYSLTTITEVE